MTEDAIQKAIDNYRQMEKDAWVISLLRSGHIQCVERFGEGWRVDTYTKFFVRATLEEAVVAALEGVPNGLGNH